MQTVLLPFVATFLLALVLTPVVIKFAVKIGAMDIPKDDRRVHRIAMPLMGGLAMYIAVVIGMLLFLPKDRKFLAILIGATLILISGIKDDIKGTTPKEKLFYQILAASVAIWGGISIENITNPFVQGSTGFALSWLTIPITLFWIVGITNTLNLIDGLDGLAGGVAFISSFSFMLVALKMELGFIGVLAALVAGACLGFLPYNFNPAKIFMGDTGSLFLGYMLAIISIEGALKSVATIAMIIPIIILGVPIFDTTFAIFRRVSKGQSIMTADKSHLHHRLLEKGFTQKKTVLILYAISGVFGLFAVLISKVNSSQAVWMSAILFVVALFFAFRLGMFSSKSKEEEDKK
ncbi:MAG: undecaprenyl/decaprenyl-phosphate alpha-N-acetylglucosaminyl 1-phosphate transferase [Tissierellia bacterium]|nr:undecaprenyl/decaprenyl-phosphate alpha-N-acetylglucosaminyl 1-phosphate transferase [Tissierellia bacterium]